MIGKEAKKGQVLAIYCHSDGYPSHNGKLLLEHYQDPAKVDELLALGNISLLARDIGVKHPFDNPEYGTPEYEAFQKQYGDMVRAYRRDRGEEGNGSSAYKLAEFPEKDTWCDYVYVLRQVKGRWRWFWSAIEDSRPLKLKPLTKKDCEE
jgi:hypothetical protein